MFNTKSQQALFVVIALSVVILLFTTGNLFTFGTGNTGLVLDFGIDHERSDEQSSVFDTAIEAILDGGIQIEDVMVGLGEEVRDGSTVHIHYVGYLADGTEFDSSRIRVEPIKFTVGSGEIIAGVEAGILGMRAGGERNIILPSEYAYGENGFGPIPGNATVMFSVTLVSVE